MKKFLFFSHFLTLKPKKYKNAQYCFYFSRYFEISNLIHHVSFFKNKAFNMNKINFWDTSQNHLFSDFCDKTVIPSNLWH